LTVGLLLRRSRRFGHGNPTDARKIARDIVGLAIANAPLTSRPVLTPPRALRVAL
jgi:hypothetical protein